MRATGTPRWASGKSGPRSPSAVLESAGESRRAILRTTGAERASYDVKIAGRQAWRRMSFADLQIRRHYDSDEVDVLAEFYRPVLSIARRYDRAVGYFSSSAFKPITSKIKC